MRRRIQGLHQAGQSVADTVPHGLLLVRVDRAYHRWDSRKPFYLVRFCVLEPVQLKGHSFVARLYCTARALWKLSWFLRDFGYDTELLAQDQIDEKSLVGLRGVVKISHTVVNSNPVLNLDGFAPTSHWEELANSTPSNLVRSEVQL